MPYTPLAATLALLIPTPGQAQAQPPSLQDQFNTATAAWERHDCAAALPLFDALGRDPRIKPGSLPAAAIAVRRGDCLLRLGQSEAGEIAILSGLPILRTAGDTFTPEVAQAEVALGKLAIARWDHDTALAHLETARDLLKGDERASVLMLIAMLTAFDGGTKGLDAAAEGLKIAEAAPKPDKKQLAQWHTAQGRILLNQGLAKEGRTALTKALNLAGGLTDHASLTDAVMRADLAQAAMLNRDTEGAYQYMAASGAGRVGSSPFAKAAAMNPPLCGPDTGLEPADTAVVEFSIADDGKVDSAQPVYANGSYAKATAFARAVSHWQWRPEDAAKIPLFFRVASRVELHCTQATGEGGASPVLPLQDRLDRWAFPLIAPYHPAIARITGWPQWLAIAEAAQKAGDTKAEIVARTYLAPLDLRAPTTALASIDHALTLATSPDTLPPEASNATRILLTSTRTATLRRQERRESSPTEQEKRADPALLALADDALIAQDPLAQDTAVLLGLAARPRSAEAAEAQAHLARVATDARLPDHHPIRQFAQLRLANDAARDGRLAEAQTWFAATGLTQEQCALIGPKPALTGVNNGASAFPWDIMRWGFEGWVRTEYDIKADGHITGIHAVIAYPPFIFSKPAQEMMTTARYQSSFRPEGGAACSANQTTVNFKIPDNQNTVKIVQKKS